MKKIKRVLFIGSKQLGLDCLKTMSDISGDTLIGCLTLDDSADTRSRFDEFKSFCADRGIPFLVAKNRADSEKIIEEQNPDICIVVGWYWIISKKTLDLVPKGFLGIHNSLLPKYRGGSPLVWSIINGEKKIGFSMFSFTEGMDEGDIWYQYEFDLKPEYFISDTLDIIEKKAVEMLNENYLNILNDNLKPVPQDHTKATYCAQRKPEDGLIDWNKSAKDIYNFIRAQSKPYPGAFTFYENKKLTIWEAMDEEYEYHGTPGQVARVSNNGVIVISGDNKPLLVRQVGFEGKDFKANELIKSINIRLSSSSNSE